MRYLFILSLLSCEEAPPNISGERGVLTFSTKTQNDFGDYWTPQSLVATHSHVNLFVKGWEVERQEFDSSKERNAAYETFFEHYDDQDFNSVKNKMKIENFTFKADVPIIATETTLASAEHRGSIRLLSRRVGKFSIEANGFYGDSIQVEFSDPAYWKVGIARKSLISDNYMTAKYHPKFCFHGTGTVDLLYATYDQKDSVLFGQFPQVKFSTTSESIDVEHKDNIFTIHVRENITEDVKMDLMVQDAFGNTVISELPSVQICPARDGFIKGFSIQSLFSEEVEVEFNHFSEKELQEYKQSIKQTKRKSPLWKFLKEAKKNNGVAWTSVIPEINSEISTFNVPITVRPEGGFVIKGEELATYSSRDDLSAIKKLGSPSLTVLSGTPLFIVYPHKQEYKLSLKSVGHQEQIVLPQKPLTEE